MSNETEFETTGALVNRVASNALPTGKKLGGITGKGFKPGQSGNPSGGSHPSREFGKFVRDWLEREVTFNMPHGKAFKKQRKKRLAWLVQKIADERPEILLHYAFGKPIEAREVQATDESRFEFCVRLRGDEMP